MRIEYLIKNRKENKNYTYTIDFVKWLSTTENKEHKEVKQFLMISIDDFYFEKYIKLCLTKQPQLFSFYLNLLWRVNGVKNLPSNKQLVGYDACLSYSTLFNRCLPREQLDEKARSVGYENGNDLWSDKRQLDTITQQIRTQLTREAVLPYLDKLQEIGLLQYSKKINNNGKPGGQFYIKIQNIVQQNKNGKHVNFICIPYCLMFDASKITNSQLLSFLLISKSKKNGAIEKKDNSCFLDFKKIVDSVKIINIIEKHIKKQLSQKQKQALIEKYAEDLQQAFIDLMGKDYIKQESEIVTHTEKLEEIENYKKMVLVNVECSLRLKAMCLVKQDDADDLDKATDMLYSRIYNSDFVEKTDIKRTIEYKDATQKNIISVNYTGNNVDLIKKVFQEYSYIIKRAFKNVIDVYFVYDNELETLEVKLQVNGENISFSAV